LGAVLALLLAAAVAGPVAAGPLLPLAGRTVVLDPGHGGTASGMVGPNGTREADLNLAVARELASSLSRLGVTVVMTRTADGDLLARPAPLKDELRARALLAESVGADLFVSLHHNATPDRLGPVDLLHRNRSEVYLKMDDEASLELGARLLAGLAHLTRSPRSQLFPSNFSVLRNNSRPAVLGEPFYLSIDLWERYAARPGFAALEAACYARAIEGFLGGPARPFVKLHAPYPGEVLTARDLTLRGETSLVAGRPPALRFTLDGRPASPNVDWPASDGFRAVFPLIPQGAHEVRVVAMDSVGRFSASERRTVEVSAPPAELQLSVHGPGGMGPRLLEVNVRDRHERPVRDGIEVRLVASPASLVRTTAGGATMFLLQASRPGEVRVTAGNRSAGLDGFVMEAPPDWCWGRATDARTGAPLPALGVTGEERSRYSTEDGVYVCPRPEPSRPLDFVSPGYVSRQLPCPAEGGALDVALQPVLEGALRGLRVSLDVSGRATEVCPALLAALAAGGAVPELRPEPSVSERVRASNTRHDDLHLLLSAAAAAGRVTFYAASPRGRALAASVSRELGLTGPVEGGDYVLSNTGGTTVAVALPPDRPPAVAAVALVSGLVQGLMALRTAALAATPPSRVRTPAPGDGQTGSRRLEYFSRNSSHAKLPVGLPTAYSLQPTVSVRAPPALGGGILLTADGRLTPEATPRAPSAPGELRP
jgi:N-acetylmuramoyl-L-alanine amidase